MTPARILVAEDEAVLAMDLQDRLEALGYEVVGVVDTGEAAVERSAALAPDVVLMDIRLKGPTDGIAAAARICERAPTPVIFLTAYSDEPTVRRATEAEPFGYLHKPVQDRELRTAVEMGLRRHQAEAKLRESERRYAATLNSVGDGIIAVDSAGRVTLLNPVAEALTGWAAGEAVGQPVERVLNLMNGQTRHPVPSPAGEALLGRRVKSLPDGTVLVSRDGRQRPVDDSAAPIAGDAGEVRGAVVAFRDVTERQEAEARLRTAQRLESLGVLAGGIAHDFKNLLTPIMGNAALLAERLAGDPGSAELVGEIELAARRAAELSRQMLAYAGRGRVQAAPVDVARLAREMAAILAAGIPKTVRLAADLPDGLPAVVGDEAQLQQVVMNLVTNAAESLPAGVGTVHVSAAAVDLPGGEPADGFAVPPPGPGRYVRVRVADTGAGIDEATRHRMFDPFYTTKAFGRGLGLAAVLGIVRGHRGALRIESEVGRGATFDVYLPASDRPAAVADVPPERPAASGSGRVLLVDDEAPIRAVLQRALERAGYEVVPAADGDEATAAFAREADGLAALVLDLTMPGRSVGAVLEDVRRSRPGLPVILISGYAADDMLARLPGLNPTAILEKPFPPHRLLDVLARVVAPPGG